MEILFDFLQFIGQVWIIGIIICQLYIMKLEFYVNKNLNISNFIQILFYSFILAICWPIVLKQAIKNEVLY